VVDVEAYDPNGNPINGLAADVNVLGSDGQAQPVTLEQQGPGRYSGKFDIAATGGYIVSVAEGGKATGSKPRVTRSGLSVAYPPEYQAVRPNTTLLSQLAETTGGRILTNPAQAFRPSGNPGESIRDLWPLLLLLASLLLPLDIAVRRLALPFAEIWAAARARLPRLRRRAAAPAPQAQAIGQLHMAKRSATPAPSGTPERVEVPAAPAAKPAPENAPQRQPVETGSAPLSTTQRLLDAKRKRDGGGTTED
jgi:hypothetical protein